MRNILIFIAFVLFCFGFVSCEKQPKRVIPATDDYETRTDPDRVFKNGDWELRIWATAAKGTRSEGHHGILLFKGDVVKASEIGEKIETSLGAAYYCGQPAPGRSTYSLNEFYCTGWRLLETPSSGEN